MYNSNPVLVIHSYTFLYIFIHFYTFLYIFIHLVVYMVYMFFMVFDNQVHVKRVDLHSQLCHFLKVYLNLWLENVGLVIWTWLETFVKATSITQTLLHFPAATTTSKLTSPFDVVQVSISLLLLVLLFSRFSCPWFGPWFGWSAVGVRGSILETKSQIRNVLRVPKNCILATYNISPRQAVKEENRKTHDFFNIEKDNFPKLLVSSFSAMF